MSALSAATLISAQREFVSALPVLQQTFRYRFRRRWRDRDDLLAEASACAWKAWRGLVARGRDPIAVGVTGIAAFAARHTLQGRRIANRRGGGRHKMSVEHRRARQLGGYTVISLDSGGPVRTDYGPAAWRAWVAMDHRMGPAEAAAFRLDFATWLASLPERRRRTAERLAEGHGTLEVARRVGVTPAAVSQARSWLARSWRDFRGETPAGCDRRPRPSCPRPRGSSDVRI